MIPIHRPMSMKKKKNEKVVVKYIIRFCERSAHTCQNVKRDQPNPRQYLLLYPSSFFQQPQKNTQFLFFFRSILWPSDDDNDLPAHSANCQIACSARVTPAVILSSSHGATCTDIHGQSMEPGRHYVPGPDICQLCICDDGQPKGCKAVLCSPPKNCKSFQVGSSCCEFICRDDTLAAATEKNVDFGI